MTERQLWEKLCNIYDTARRSGSYEVAAEIDALIRERWGNTTPPRD